MEDRSKHATISLNMDGDVVEVEDKYGKPVSALVYEPAQIDGRCPEGHEVVEIKKIQFEYVTCANLTTGPGPCWVYDPIRRRWYKIC
jgi:hypothetical protein